MLVAWPWRDVWECHLILPTKAACQMQISKAVVPLNLVCYLLQCYLVLHHIQWWLGIKGKRAHLILGLCCFIGSWHDVLVGSIWASEQIFFIYELRIVFPLVSYHFLQYDGFLMRNVTCLQGFNGKAKDQWWKHTGAVWKDGVLVMSSNRTVFLNFFDTNTEYVTSDHIRCDVLTPNISFENILMITVN